VNEGTTPEGKSQNNEEEESTKEREGTVCGIWEEMKMFG
jgi:hypothetical protein